MGGKNPLVVLDDADLELAVEAAVNGAFYSTGQRCTASSRLIVTRGAHDAFVTRLAERCVALRVGHALEPDSQIGPVASADQFAKNLAAIADARRHGSELLCGGQQIERPTCGGQQIERPTCGHYLAPALFTGGDPQQPLYREEIFAPVAAVMRADDYEHALALANDTPYGLVAGICTGSLKHAGHFRRHAEAGMVMVNLPTAGVDYHVPFGGRKASSYGPREQGRYAAEFYTAVKTAYVAA
jgi:aldehyde dehydrogenase (NAD+)